MPALREPRWITSRRRRALALFKSFSFPKVTIVDPDPVYLNPDQTARYFDADGCFYYDGDHLNATGAMQMKPLLEPFFKELAR